VTHKRAVIVAMALWLAASSPVAAATIPVFEAELRFVGCEGVSGSYFTWSPAWHSTRDAAYAEIVDRGGPDFVTWGATSPLDVWGGAPVYPPDTYEESGYATGDAFLVLLAADGTVVYEAALGVSRPPNREAYFALRATLDCSSVPYRAVPMPDAAMPAPDARPSIGALMLCMAAATVALRRLALAASGARM